VDARTRSISTSPIRDDPHWPEDALHDARDEPIGWPSTTPASRRPLRSCDTGARAASTSSRSTCASTSTARRMIEPRAGTSSGRQAHQRRLVRRFARISVRGGVRRVEARRRLFALRRAELAKTGVTLNVVCPHSSIRR
jgi:hypothetical protein